MSQVIKSEPHVSEIAAYDEAESMTVTSSGNTLTDSTSEDDVGGNEDGYSTSETIWISPSEIYCAINNKAGGQGSMYDEHSLDGEIDVSKLFFMPFNGKARIALTPLPRPIDAMNCGMSRRSLVKLIRASNQGGKPMYGNPHTKPPFWPNEFWPWTKMTDAHIRPAGMTKPHLYSVMMRVAIARGYFYYGYNPFKYVLHLNELPFIADLSSLDDADKLKYLVYLLKFEAHVPPSPRVRFDLSDDVSWEFTLCPMWWPHDLLSFDDASNILLFSDTSKKTIDSILDRAISHYTSKRLVCFGTSDTQALSSSRKRDVNGSSVKPSSQEMPSLIPIRSCTAPRSVRATSPPTSFAFSQSVSNLLQMSQSIWRDRMCRRTTDVVLVSCDNIRFPVHSSILALNSPAMGKLIADHMSSNRSRTLADDIDGVSVILADISSHSLTYLVRVLYCFTGFSDERKIMSSFQSPTKMADLKYFVSLGLIEGRHVEMRNELFIKRDLQSSARHDLSDQHSVPDSILFFPGQVVAHSTWSLPVPLLSQYFPHVTANVWDKLSTVDSAMIGVIISSMKRCIAACATISSIEDIIEHNARGNIIFASWLIRLGILTSPKDVTCSNCSGPVVMSANADDVDDITWCCVHRTLTSEHSQFSVRHASIFHSSVAALFNVSALPNLFSCAMLLFGWHRHTTDDSRDKLTLALEMEPIMSYGVYDTVIHNWINIFDVLSCLSDPKYSRASIQ